MSFLFVAREGKWPPNKSATIIRQLNFGIRSESKNKKEHSVNGIAFPHFLFCSRSIVVFYTEDTFAVNKVTKGIQRDRKKRCKVTEESQRVRSANRIHEELIQEEK